MPPKRKSDVKAALQRVGDALRHRFRSHLVTEPNIEPTSDLNNTNWDGLERLHGILNMNVQAFGPLTFTISRFSGRVKMFENQARAREEYKKLGVDLNDLFHTLAEHFKGADPPPVPLDRFGILARSIDEETKSLEVKTGSRPNDDGNTTKDVDEALRCYRRVRTLLAMFVMNESVKMWRVDDDEALNTRLELLIYPPNAHYRAVGSKGVRRTGCTPNTRVGVLQDIREWVHYGKFQKVYWLNGIAGTGKTAIAYSLCEDLEISGKPAASFFCSRDIPECRDVRRIFPGLSYQLLQLSRPFRYAVSSALEQFPEVYNQPIDEQFKRLVAVPLQNVGHTFGVDVVIVIDGLEECEDKNGVNQVLDACFGGSSGLPVRFLITSCQNQGILDRMRANQGVLRRAELRLHELDQTVAQEDIRTYLRSGLEGFGLSANDLEWLAKRSGGSFIYAASVVKYLNQGDFPERTERLKRLLDIAPRTEDAMNQHIDTIYTAMLEEALDNSGLDESKKAEMRLLLRTAVCARESPTLHAIAELLRLDLSSLMDTTLLLLLPALHVSDASGLGITLCNSFSEYLIDRQRSGRFHCDSQLDNVLLAQVCLHLIGEASPPFNICNLDSSHLLDREVVGIDERVNEAISQGLWYASRNWGTHLALTKASADLLTGLHDFLSKRLLLWMEIVNLKGQMSVAATLLHNVHMWLQKADCPTNIRDLILDAWMFVEVFSSSVTSESTPHIYVSALEFWPADRPVSTCYMPMLRSVVKGTRVILGRYGGNSAVLDGLVTRNVHSPQCFDAIVGRAGSNPYGWHVGPGTQVDPPLEGHTAWVCSVACSPDGAYIASGSKDGTIRIWDAHTGKRVGQPLNGRTGEVLSIAYSPDGAHIASGSYSTVWVWDAHTGKPVGQPLSGHTSMVRSVAYSPDGAYIASGSDDETIRIWDARGGQPVGQPLIGHTGGVNSVAYSPDGAYLASGSNDNTVRIWDVHTGKPVGCLLSDHKGWVVSVAYSPYGTYIASGSYDETVRIWDAHTGKPVGQPLNGHTGGVLSIAYSPDGAYIASGSKDGTVRIWDAHTGKPMGQPLNGHTNTVGSVAYSPDGAYIASGSGDSTVRIWDSRPGTGAQSPEALLPSNPLGTYPPSRSLIHSALFRHVTRILNKLTPTHLHTSSISTAEVPPHCWVLDDQGWVVNAHQERFIWIPHDLRTFIVLPPTLMIIPLVNHVILDFFDAKLGIEWRDCFDSSQLCI